MALVKRSTHLAPAGAAAIAAAAACLRQGGLVAMPTETVYGLAADATSDKAVAGVFAAKGRPAFNPLIAHVLDVEQAKRFAVFPRQAEILAEAFWPGPLTLVLPVEPGCRVSLLARAGLDTVALRAPAHETARALIEAVGAPLAAPSANRSGRVSPTTAAHVVADLDGRIDWILDGGACRFGLEIDDRRLPRCGARAPSSRRGRPRGDRGSDWGAAWRGPIRGSADCAGTPQVPLRAARPSSARGLGRSDRRSRPRLWRRIVGAPLDGAARPFAVRGPGRGGLEPVRAFARIGRKRRPDHRGRSGSRSRSRSGDQ